MSATSIRLQPDIKPSTSNYDFDFDDFDFDDFDFDDFDFDFQRNCESTHTSIRAEMHDKTEDVDPEKKKADTRYHTI
jgi:hypothetical protein